MAGRRRHTGVNEMGRSNYETIIEKLFLDRYKGHKTDLRFSRRLHVR